MADEPQIKAWKFIEPPFIPLFVVFACVTIFPIAFGGYTSECSITIACVMIASIIACILIERLFYNKHERVIVAWELDIYKAKVKSREQFLATGKWPDKE